MELKRRASLQPLDVVVGMVIALFVLGVVSFGFYYFTGKSFKDISPIEISSRNKLCKIRGSQLVAEIGELKEIIDQDKDSFPDDCDICLGGDNNKVESNSLGIPDACYIDFLIDKKFLTYKDMCLARDGCYSSDKDQCCIQGGECPPNCKYK